MYLFLSYMDIHVSSTDRTHDPSSWEWKTRMDDLGKALEILSEAEGALSTLMRRGLAEQRYDDVAAVADVTQLLSDLMRSVENPSPEDEERGPSKADAGRGENPTPGVRPPSDKNHRGTPGGSYPQFARDGDRLVKVGWSSKARQEYEHRTHRKVLWAFARVVRDRPDAANCFTMEDVLPLVYAGGKEIPSYQAYLALAWLRSVEAIRREGRHGYRPDLFKLSDESVMSLWESLPDHV